MLNLSSLISALINSVMNTDLTLTPQTFEMVDTSLASTVLTILTVLSLALTFYANGTTVHKVLGLLLVSVFVVFLWILQTQFLFIYVVYIMAFISAVLMLFLSVVLMLPISTLTSRNYATDSNTSTLSILPFLVSSSFIESELGSSLIHVILGSSLVVVLVSVSVLYKSYKRLDWDGTTLAFTLKEFYNGFLDIEIIRKALSWVRLGPRTTLPTMIQFGFPLPRLSRDNIQTVLNYMTLLVFVIYSLAKFLLWVSYKMVTYFATKLWYAAQLIYKHGRNILEAAAQTYLYVGITSFIFALVTIKQDWFKEQANSLSLDGSLGLSQIKDLLYGDQSYLLLFSTTVLLVALIGAAVMTRNKR